MVKRNPKHAKLDVANFFKIKAIPIKHEQVVGVSYPGDWMCNKCEIGGSQITPRLNHCVKCGGKLQFQEEEENV